jgi:hypothetical protein
MTDWNENLALLLYGLSASALGNDPAGGNLPLSVALPEDKAKLLRERFELAWSWVSCAADRAPLPAAGAPKAPEVDWNKAPELTHPISSARLSLEPIASPDRIRGALAAALDEPASRLAGDARKQALWVWRHLPDRLMKADGGLGQDWWRFPSDGRSPQHSVWHEVRTAAALAAASPDPVLMTFEVSFGDTPVGATAAEIHADSSLHGQVSWAAARALVEDLAPFSILLPALDFQPIVDRWLAEEGVVKAADAGAPDDAVGFPSCFVALVPASRVEEVGAKCVQAASGAWAKLAAAAGKHDAAWLQQAASALEARWTAVPLEEDSTGAGALLPGRDISGYEKIVKLRREASGTEQAGKGAFFGLWSLAARAAADARRSTCSPAAQASSAPCTVCGVREQSSSGDGLCAACGVRRSGAQPAKGGEALPLTLVLMNGDGMGAIMRGALETKEGATLKSTLHSQVPQQLLKARGRWRDGLDSAVLGGPARLAAVAEALGAFSMGSARDAVDKAGGQMLALAGDEVAALVPRAQALEVTTRLRARYREPFVSLPVQGIVRRALHLGHAATTSCVIAVSWRDRPGALLRRCRKVLQVIAKQTLDRDALVVLVRTETGREYMFGGHWGEADDNLGTAIALLRAVREPAAFLASLSALGPALTNQDLDRSKTEARLGLIRNVIASHAPDHPEAERVSRAILALIDRNGASSPDAEGGLDGVQVAAFLAEGVQ